MYVTRRTLTSWQEEYAGTNWLPPIGAALALFALVALVLLALLGGPASYADIVDRVNEGKPPTLCEEHVGRPGWAAVCDER
jgi:hypothetical protein